MVEIKYDFWKTVKKELIIALLFIAGIVVPSLIESISAIPVADRTSWMGAILIGGHAFLDWYRHR